MRIPASRITTNLRLPDPRPLWNLPPHIAGAICTFAVICIVALVGRIATTPASVKPEPIIIVATSPAAVPIATPMAQQAAHVPAAPVRQVVAFAAPDNGVVLGPIPWDANSPILGRWGDSMIMTAWQGSNVWVRVSELGGSLANLAPEVPQYQPAAPQVIYQVVNQEAPAYAVPTPAQQEAPAGPPVDQRQAAIQARLANEHQAQPTEPPTSGIFHQQTETQIESQRLAWAMEHCTDPSDPRTCLP